MLSDLAGNNTVIQTLKELTGSQAAVIVGSVQKRKERFSILPGQTIVRVLGITPVTSLKGDGFELRNMKKMDNW